MNQRTYEPAGEPPPSGIRLPAAAGVLAGLLVLSFALALVAEDDAAASRKSGAPRISPVVVTAPAVRSGDPSPVIGRDGSGLRAVARTTISPTAAASAQAPVKPNPATEPPPIEEPAAAGAPEEVASKLEVSSQAAEDSIGQAAPAARGWATLAVPRGPARSDVASTPLGSDVWSPILGAPLVGRRIAERKVDVDDLLG